MIVSRPIRRSPQSASVKKMIMLLTIQRKRKKSMASLSPWTKIFLFQTQCYTSSDALPLNASKGPQNQSLQILKIWSPKKSFLSTTFRVLSGSFFGNWNKITSLPQSYFRLDTSVMDLQQHHLRQKRRHLNLLRLCLHLQHLQMGAHQIEI